MFIRRFINRILYKFSNSRLEMIKELDGKIKQCNDDIMRIEQARFIDVSWYDWGYGGKGDRVSWQLYSDTYILKNILIEGLREYRKSLEKKKNKYLSL